MGEEDSVLASIDRVVQGQSTMHEYAPPSSPLRPSTKCLSP